jgi:hypothetical protein
MTRTVSDSGWDLGVGDDPEYDDSGWDLGVGDDPEYDDNPQSGSSQSYNPQSGSSRSPTQILLGTSPIYRAEYAHKLVFSEQRPEQFRILILGFDF